jgi:hypothetical protein
VVDRIARRGTVMKVTSLPRFAIFVYLCIVIWYVAFLTDAINLSNTELTNYIQEEYHIDSKVTKRHYDSIDLVDTQTDLPFEIFTAKKHNLFEVIGYDTAKENYTRTAYTDFKHAYEESGFTMVLKGIPFVVTYPKVADDKSKPIRTIFYFKYEGYLDHLRIQEKDYKAITELVSTLNKTTDSFDLVIYGMSKLDSSLLKSDTPKDSQFSKNSVLTINNVENIETEEMLKDRILEASKDALNEK